jgi:tRNA A37 threonylcarbamoyladenosine modification protein TsaB
VVDARRSEVFWALYLPGQGMVGQPAVATPEDLADTLAGLGHQVLAVGDGAQRYERVLVGSGGRVEVRGGYPSAVDLVAIASAMHDERTVLPAALRPMYLRQADVRIGWAQRAPQAPAVVA